MGLADWESFETDAVERGFKSSTTGNDEKANLIVLLLKNHTNKRKFEKREEENSKKMPIEYYKIGSANPMLSKGKYEKQRILAQKGRLYSSILNDKDKDKDQTFCADKKNPLKTLKKAIAMYEHYDALFIFNLNDDDFDEIIPLNKLKKIDGVTGHLHRLNFSRLDDENSSAYFLNPLNYVKKVVGDQGEQLLHKDVLSKVLTLKFHIGVQVLYQIRHKMLCLIIETLNVTLGNYHNNELQSEKGPADECLCHEDAEKPKDDETGLSPDALHKPEERRNFKMIRTEKEKQPRQNIPDRKHDKSVRPTVQNTSTTDLRGKTALYDADKLQANRGLQVGQEITSLSSPSLESTSVSCTEDIAGESSVKPSISADGLGTVLPCEVTQRIIITALRKLTKHNWRNKQSDALTSALKVLLAVCSEWREIFTRDRRTRRLVVAEINRLDPFLVYRPQPVAVGIVYGSTQREENGAAICDGRLYVTAISSPVLTVYDVKTFRQLSDIKLDQHMKDPWDIVGCERDRCLYIFEGFNDVIRWSIDGYVTDRWSLNGEHRGLSLTRNCNVIIAYRNSLEERNGKTGDIVRRIPLDKRIPEASFAIQQYSVLNNVSDRFLVCSGNGMYAVQHMICVVDPSGKIMETYSSSSSKTFHQPVHLAVDRNGCVLVADISDRRIVLTKTDDTSMSHELTVDNNQSFCWPIKVCLDEKSGNMFVVTLNGDLMCYNVLNGLHKQRPLGHRQQSGT